MKTPQILAMDGCTPLGFGAPAKVESPSIKGKIGEPELLTAEDIPFNLAGELLDESLNAEGEARVRAIAESEARKAQLQIDLEILDGAPTDQPLNDQEIETLGRVSFYESGLIIEREP